jgi:tetratricopeptide (TPR) repeat protein
MKKQTGCGCGCGRSPAENQRKQILDNIHTGYGKFNLPALYKLGKEKLAGFQYSEAIKIYQEIMRRNLDDPVFQTKSIDIEIDRDSLAGKKVLFDEEIIKKVDNSKEVQWLLIELSNIYGRAKDYDTVFKIYTEIRKAYVDSPWPEKTVVIENEGNLPAEFCRLQLDIVLHTATAEILAKQNKYNEARKSFQVALDISEDSERLKIVPNDKIDDLIILKNKIKQSLDNLSINSIEE